MSKKKWERVLGAEKCEVFFAYFSWVFFAIRKSSVSKKLGCFVCLLPLTLVSMTEDEFLVYCIPCKALSCVWNVLGLQVLDSLDAVLDVGGVYDPSRDRYDHHQKGFDEVFGHGFSTKLSSAGLVYKVSYWYWRFYMPFWMLILFCWVIEIGMALPFWVLILFCGLLITFSWLFHLR